MSKPLSTVILTTKGEVRRANIAYDENGDMSVDAIQRYFRKKEKPEELTHAYRLRDMLVYVFGYTKGKAGTENKNVLPSPLNAKQLYGDIILIMCQRDGSWQEAPLPMTPENWKEIVEQPSATGASGAGATTDAEAGVDADDDDESADEDDDSIDEDKDVDEDEDETGDAFAEDDELEPAAEEGEGDEDEFEPEPQIVRRRKPLLATVKTDPNAFKEEVDITLPASSHPIRKACLTQLMDLSHMFAAEDIENLELAIFRNTFEAAKRHYIPRNWKSIHFQELYKQSSRSILWNIHPKSPVRNPRLLMRVNEGEFPLEAIANMNAYDMYPENWRELADKQLIREQKILEGNKSRATDQYKCRRCNKRECTYYEMQTRSADEPMTIFITCLNCGKQWRQ